jgi:hypothetical protein
MLTGTYWLLVGGFSSSLATYPIGGPTGTKLYIGLVAFVVNLVVVGVWSAAARLAGGTRPAEEEATAA